MNHQKLLISRQFNDEVYEQFPDGIKLLSAPNQAKACVLYKVNLENYQFEKVKLKAILENQAKLKS